MKEVLLQCAKILWEFTRLDQILVKSEVMIVLGNDDPRSAEYAADLFHEGWAPLVVISGKEGSGTRGKLPVSMTEADVFCNIMTARGVPRENIILEKEATNTGQNIQFTQRFLRSLGHQPKSILIVTKSLMELRAALTFQKQWENSEAVHLCVSSPPLSLLEYPSADVGTLDQVLEYLLVHFKKFTDYAKCGHQAPIDIPAHVQRAYAMLEAQFKQEKEGFLSLSY
ncbi:YdcF family protein [Biomphalaria pfeifferi]|uniref:YdcF family protein n=1 Tax=Biomphalaria pfeifferi TaxID=112525 RepID=A0AAD8EVH2_BIOPF|nr:YdcF family protein [Biomphalaria pfeifferi]